MGKLWFPLAFILTALLLASCAPAAPTQTQGILKQSETAKEGQQAPAQTQPVAPAPIEQPTQTPTAFFTRVAPLPTQAGNEPSSEAELPAQPLAPTPSAKAHMPTQPAYPTLAPLPTASPALSPSPTPEDHLVQVEWPKRMRLGESDVVNLALVPSSQGLLLVAEYPEHQVITQTIAVQRSQGYELFAVARLDGVGFEISPSGEQAQYLEPGGRLSWRWSLKPRLPGSHRLSAAVLLRWMPVEENTRPVRETVVYSHALDVQVISYLGLSKSQAALTGLLTLLLGGGLSLFALVVRPRNPRPASPFDSQTPNPQLAIELPPGLQLGKAERGLLQSLFQRYARLIVEHEFLSGYSGARTFLALPIRRDGRSDAYTIAKIGEKQAILREYRNYETFVKDTLPPITARIQRQPVSNASAKDLRLAALQYTFIGEPGRPPRSLRDAFLDKPEPELIDRLLETFGPNWWLQHKPLTFRMAEQYDRVLPTHLIIEPDDVKGLELDGRQPIGDWQPGDRVTLHNFPTVEMRLDGASLSLQGEAVSGSPPLRVRWLSTQRPEGASGRVIATRQSLLRGLVTGLDLFGLPDPLDSLEALLSETVHGSQSILHGDLNLENILVGPGGMLWLIDFAQTREGHTLFDFAHLGAEIIAHIAAEKIADPALFLASLQGSPDSGGGEINQLMHALERAAARLVFNPSSLREYRLALAISCLGALKYVNLGAHARHLLYLNAAYILQS